MKNKNIIKAISGYSTEKLQSFSNANIITNGKISYIDGNKLKDIISKFILNETNLVQIQTNLFVMKYCVELKKELKKI